MTGVIHNMAANNIGVVRDLYNKGYDYDSALAYFVRISGAVVESQALLYGCDRIYGVKFSSLQELEDKAKARGVDGFVEFLENLWDKKLYSHEKLISIINQVKDDLIKSDPRIISFTNQQNFDPEPPSIPNSPDSEEFSSFEEFLSTRQDFCTSSEDNYKECIYNYCTFLNPIGCTKEQLPQFNEFRSDEL